MGESLEKIFSHKTKKEKKSKKSPHLAYSHLFFTVIMI